MLHRLPGLDGLRAVAVTAVIAYHCAIPRFFDGGFLGVDVFFAISGFLITALLLDESQRAGRIAIGRFYSRRARRLLPPALALMAVTTLLTPLLAPDAFARLRADVPYALVYASNWWQIHSQQSYFEALGYPPLLQHLWSLALEEQYYLVWPLLFGLLLKRLGRAGAGWASGVLALISTLWMGHVYQTTVDGGDPSRAYLGTDTHLMGLLAGSALACFWRPWGGAAPAPWPGNGPRPAFIRTAVFWVSAIGLAAMVGLLNHAQPWLFQGGFLLAALFTCGLIVGVTVPAPGLARILGSRPVQWVGTRSYSLYLVHWPVFVWLRPARENAAETCLLTLSALLVTGVWAELSYRFVEQRFRRPRSSAARIPWAVVSAALLAGGAAAALVAPGAFDIPAQSNPGGLALESVAHPPWQHDEVPGAGKAAALAALAGIEPDAAENPRDGREIVAIGDSVLLGAREFLARTLPGIIVDARTNRQAHEGARLIRELSSRQSFKGKVVIHLGTNGYILEHDLRRLLSDLEACDSVVIVNVHANRRWTPVNNALIEQVLADYRNVRLVNWSDMARERPDFLVSDGIHLTGSGIRAYVDAIRRALGALPELPVPAVLARSVPKASSSAKPAALGRADAGSAGGPEGAPQAGVAPVAPTVADPPPDNGAPAEVDARCTNCDPRAEAGTPDQQTIAIATRN